MSCKYLCQVGALECASTCSDRCEFPVGAGMIERFGGSGLLPLPVPRPGHQHCARALPPLPLRDPVIEGAEHGVYFGRTSERSRWRERERDERRERQIKDRGREERHQYQSQTDTSVGRYWPVKVISVTISIGVH